MNRLLYLSVLLAIVATTSGCEDGGGEITVYPVGCSEQSKDNKCSGSWVPLNRTTYKVLVQQQRVIYWMTGFDIPPDSLHNCVVRDRENWKCELGKNFATLYMVNGSFREEFRHKSEDSGTEMRHVSSWRWWQLKLGLTKNI